MHMPPFYAAHSPHVRRSHLAQMRMIVDRCAWCRREDLRRSRRHLQREPSSNEDVWKSLPSTRKVLPTFDE